MCGINGIVRLVGEAPAIDEKELIASRQALASRGPDGCGTWFSPGGVAAFAHRRLAIIDLSKMGQQPMRSQDGRHVIIFNGEIYNYREIRRQLVARGVRFFSRSDTEVLLALWILEGADGLRRLRGMYAFAVWDEAEGRLTLVRDPYGIKPLYYRRGTRHLRFASQARVLMDSQHCGEPDPAAVVAFLLWGHVPEPFTLDRQVRAVPAGSYLEVAGGRIAEPRAFHTFRSRVAAKGSEGPRGADPQEALRDSVRAHLVSDVPVGIFLSAGLDSALVTALACRELEEPPLTITLAFEDFAGTVLDEAPLAREIAAQLGTRHLEHVVSRRKLEASWESFLGAMDQPSIDGFNTYLVSQVAAEAGLKVVLSGLGGDELFGSYSSFADVPLWHRWARRLRLVEGPWRVLSRRLRSGLPKLPALIRYAQTLSGAYFLRRGVFLPEEIPEVIDPQLARAGLESYDPVRSMEAILRQEFGGEEPAPWIAVQAMESSGYLRNQLLRDADWASMTYSLELRVPLVDTKLRESLGGCGFEPARSQGKAHLVRRLAPELPAPVFARRKTGFATPAMHCPLDSMVEPSSLSPGAASRRLACCVLNRFGVPARLP